MLKRRTDDFDQQTECEALVCWWKYTTHVPLNDLVSFSILLSFFSFSLSIFKALKRNLKLYLFNLPFGYCDNLRQKPLLIEMKARLFCICTIIFYLAECRHLNLF